MSHRPLAVALVLLLAVSAHPRPARSADPPPDSANSSSDAENASTGEASAEYERLMKQGREAYNQSEWTRAARLYRQAAQVAPKRPESYRNLARAHFMAERYARAAALYDQYLEIAPKSANTDRIERERKLATHRAGDKVWTKPEAQKRVLEALREALTDGQAYTEGGGGAWALYKTLLRTGYVHPDLAHIQTRLRERLLEEFEQQATPESKQPTPVLSLQDWQRQQRRLEAARSLTDAADVRERIDDRTRIVETALALLNGRSGDAATHAAAARKAHPDMEFLRWFELAALIGDERYDDAEKRLEAISNNSSALSEPERRYLRVLKAVVDQRRGDVESAAERYRRVLQ